MTTRINDAWKSAAENGDFKEAVYQYVKAWGSTSFAELQRDLGQYFTVDGNCTLVLDADTNCVVWDGVSVQFIEAVVELLREKRLIAVSCHWLVYLHDGCVLRMPVAKRPPSCGYKKPHWMPATLHAVSRGETTDGAESLRALNPPDSS